MCDSKQNINSEIDMTPRLLRLLKFVLNETRTKINESNECMTQGKVIFKLT